MRVCATKLVSRATAWRAFSVHPAVDQPVDDLPRVARGGRGEVFQELLDLRHGVLDRRHRVGEPADPLLAADDDQGRRRGLPLVWRGRSGDTVAGGEVAVAVEAGEEEVGAPLELFQVVDPGLPDAQAPRV